MTRTSISVQALFSSAPIVFGGSVAYAADTSTMAMLPWGGLTVALAFAAWIGFYAWRSRRQARHLALDAGYAQEARLSSEEALSALLLDRADGAAIWSGSTLQVTAGHARTLEALENSSDFRAAALALVDEQDAGDLTGKLRDLIEQGTQFEANFRGPDGRPRLISGVTLGARALVTLVDAKGSHAHLPRLSDRLVAAETQAKALNDGFAKAPLYAWRRNESGRIDWVNGKYVEGVEAPSLDTVLTCQIELLSGDRADIIRSLAKKAIESGKEVNGRHSTILNGTRTTLQISETPYNGGTFGYAVDISAQVTASEALVRQMRANEETLDRLHRGVAVFNSDMRLGFANATFVQTWSLDAAWLETHPTMREILNFLREKNRLPHAREFQKWRDDFIVDCKTVSDPVERHWHLPDGRSLHVIAQPHPMGGVMVLFEDVTDHYTIRRDAATVSAVYNATFSRLGEGVVVFGLDGRCRLANRSFRELWELKEDELKSIHITELGRKCAHLFSDRPIWAKAIAHVSAADGEREVWIETLKRTDGTVIRMASAPLPDGATMFAFQDVTDSFHKERMLTEQNEKLNEISDLKGQFLESIHGASHELKIPLNTIIGFSDLLRQEVRGRLNDRQHEFVDNIAQASNELRQLISGIIDLAMLESDYFEFCIEAIDIKPMLSSIAEFIRRNSGAGATIVLDCPENIGTLPGDAPRFREVIHTLTNALRNEAETDDIIEIGVRRQGEFMTVWIGCRDSIIPLSIRDIFGRNDLSNAIPQLRRVEMGITLVRQFVERQGGLIAIETGEGNTREAIVCRFLYDGDAVRAAINQEREPAPPSAAE